MIFTAPSDLHKLLAWEGSIGEQKTQKLTYDLVSALYYLHSHRILHRDLKPQNILLDRQQVAKLCDFGLARNMTMGTHVLTSIKGTPLYMAPELMAEKPYDYQADLWSLGCIIYESLAGQPPFSTNSIYHLLRLMNQEDIKWPSFLSDVCISFLQGLLEKDPTLRMTWPDILAHPFVKGNIVILAEDSPESPFTHPLTASQSREKERQAEQILTVNSKMHATNVFNANHFPSDMLPLKNLDLTKLKPRMKTSRDEDLVSSRDSIHAILQSDLENIETDYEEIMGRNGAKLSGNFDKNLINVESEKVLLAEVQENVKQRKFASENIDKLPLTKPGLCSASAENLNHKPSHPKRNSVQEISYSMSHLDFTDKSSNDKPKSEVKRKESASEINPPDMLPGWDSCEEPQSPSIENDEWLAFIHRSMQEVLGFELDSLKQQNLVSILVAPLRNSKTSCKVIESVTQLLSLPLVLGGPPSVIQEIKNVYVEVKLVPNLVYASKLLCHRRQYLSDKTKSQPEEIVNTPSPQNTTQPIVLGQNLSSILLPEEVKTLSSLYELICHLIHLNDSFLTQFCDALAILGASNLLVQFISGSEYI